MRIDHAARLGVISSLFALVACGGGDNDADGLADTSPTSSSDASAFDDGAVESVASAPLGSETSASDVAAESPEGAESEGVACALLDDVFLNETFADQIGTFGEPFDFQAGVGSSDGLFCKWNDSSTGLNLQLTIEDSSTAETDDHSGRAYNIDVEPVAAPQDGPGEKAVLLVDQAFDDLGGDGFPYGYFFVQADTAVFVETVGLSIGADGLRTLADEVSARLAG